eukprot:CAMPEP_0171431084 /NCGR_PEP_ID=MMETSP0881-20121228/7012_1 /TAXON_ID=67004 /ORGANISM="Thalassiosira weissflogii, Strain CCMP1336" /LENGTH=57 /DNA_ID=CAMNT_0011951303 /DNA_START=14 /DNA_END=184 /DNA_ORIENTATION=+
MESYQNTCVGGDFVACNKNADGFLGERSVSRRVEVGKKVGLCSEVAFAIQLSGLREM